jgi:hypothetical protein
MEVLDETYYICSTDIVLSIVSLFGAEWKNDYLACFICSKSYRSVAVWKSILRLCLSDEYIDDTGRMAIKKT